MKRITVYTISKLPLPHYDYQFTIIGKMPNYPTQEQKNFSMLNKNNYMNRIKFAQDKLKIVHNSIFHNILSKK